MKIGMIGFNTTLIARSCGLLLAGLFAGVHSVAYATDVTGDRLAIGNSPSLGSGATDSSIAGGNQNSITGTQGFIGSGNDNSISGAQAVIGGGNSNTNTASLAVIGGGFYNYATGIASFIPGGADAYTSLAGQYAHACGSFSSPGDAQTSEYVLRSLSTATNTELFLTATDVLVVPTNAAWAFDVTVVVQSIDGTSAAFKTNGLIKNVAGTMKLFGGPITLAPYAADAGASTWTVGLSADTANLALAITGNSNNATNRWVATVHTTEVKQ